MTKMDELGKRGYKPFIDHYKTIWNHYTRYGDRVIEVEFDESEDEVKNIFLRAKGGKTLEEALTELWIKRYQIIINSCVDIEKVYLELNGSEERIPVVSPRDEGTETRKFCISLNFFNKLVKNQITDSNYLLSYVFINECVYVISCYHQNSSRIAAIVIENKIPIASMLKDE